MNRYNVKRTGSRNVMSVGSLCPMYVSGGMSEEFEEWGAGDITP